MYTTQKPPHAHERRDTWLKWLRIIAYLCMAVAGILLLLSPVLTDVYRTAAEVMSWFLFIGGTLATIGSYREEWWGEFMGLPLLGSSFAVFGVISWRLNTDGAPYLAGANLLLLLGVALAMAARWRDARNTYRIAVFGAKHKAIDEHGGDPL